MTRTDVVALAQRLIRTPSPVHEGDERAVAACVQDVLGELGLPAAVEYAQHPDRPNLVVTLELSDAGRHLALCGHLDTKPVGQAQWTVDPYEAAIVGDRLYGLGSADMKGAIAAMLVAAAELAERPPQGLRTLTLVLTADEEDGAVHGAQYLASALTTVPDALVIGEPGGIERDFDSIHLASRGLARFRAEARARQGHSSLSALDGMRNAGVDLAALLVALGEHPTLHTPPNQGRLRDWSATLNPGMSFHGGYGYGVMAESIAADVEVRTLPGMTPEQLVADLRDVARQVADRTGAAVSIDEEGGPRAWIPGSTIERDDPLVGALQRATHRVLDTSPALSVFPGTTDTSWFAAAHPSLPCVPAFGPGLLRRAHGADEWVSVEALRQTVGLYTALGEEFAATGQVST